MKLSEIDFRYSHITFEQVEVVVGVFTHYSTVKCLRLKWFTLKHKREVMHDFLLLYPHFFKLYCNLNWLTRAVQQVLLSDRESTHGKLSSRDEHMTKININRSHLNMFSDRERCVSLRYMTAMAGMCVFGSC